MFVRILASVGVAGLLASGLLAQPAHAAVTPYCMADHFAPRHVGVVGPADGRITINGHRKSRLVLVDDDVANERDDIARGTGSPFDGLRYVQLKRTHRVGSIVVRVNGRRCETT